MKKKKITVMTSFGPVPFEAIKEFLPKEVVETLSGASEAFAKTYYIESLAKRMRRPAETMADFLDTLWKVNPTAVFITLLKEIAIELDKKYDDHISKSDEIYVVSTFDGRICKACKKHIKSYRNFAAFRTLEDARTACKILRRELKLLFSEGK